MRYSLQLDSRVCDTMSMPLKPLLYIGGMHSVSPALSPVLSSSGFIALHSLSFQLSFSPVRSLLLLLSSHNHNHTQASGCSHIHDLHRSLSHSSLTRADLSCSRLALISLPLCLQQTLTVSHLHRISDTRTGRQLQAVGVSSTDLGTRNRAGKPRTWRRA